MIGPNTTGLRLTGKTDSECVRQLAFRYSRIPLALDPFIHLLRSLDLVELGRHSRLRLLAGYNCWERPAERAQGRPALVDASHYQE